MVTFFRSFREEYTRLWREDRGFKWVVYGNALLWAAVLTLALIKN